MSILPFSSRIVARSLLNYKTGFKNLRYISLSSKDHGQLGTVPKPHLNGMLPSVHWTIERALMIGMIPLFPVAMYVDGSIMNFLVISSVSMHSYWGLAGVIRDYAFERRYGPLLMPALTIIWQIFSGVGFAGLLYFNYNDVGFITAVKKLWAV